MATSSIKDLKKRLPIHKPAVIASCTLAGIGTALGVAIPWFAKLLIDDQNSKEYLMLLAGIVLVSTVLSVIGRYAFNKTVIGWICNMRTAVSTHVLGANMSFFNAKNSSTLSSEILNFSEKVKDLFISTTMHGISIGISMISAVILFILSWKLSLVMIASLLVLVIVLSPISSILSKTYKKNETALTKLIGTLSGIFSEIRLVKSYTAEETEAKRIQSQAASVKDLSIKFAKANASVEPLILTILILDLFVIFVYGGTLVARQEMTIGALIAFCLYLFQIISPMVNIGEFFKDKKTLNEMAKNIVAVFELETEASGTKPVADLLQNETVTFDRVSFKYTDEQEAQILKELSLEIPPKNTLAIVGPSGSGKSTLFNLLERFYTSYTGTIRAGNTDIKEFNLKEWRGKISFVQQMSAVTEDTLLNNLTYGAQGTVSLEIVEDALKKVDMYDYINSLPEKLNTVLQEKGSNFSSGQLQRLMIARALIKQPDMLLLDEITANLDSENEQLVKNTLDALKKEKTIVIIAHRLSTVKSADKIIFLDNGTITGTGTHKELLKTHALYEKYVQNQLI